MGRKSSVTIGETIGPFVVLDRVGVASAGKHARFLVRCTHCDETAEMYSSHIRRSNSCGCLQHRSDTWKSSGPKTMPWQLGPGEAAFNCLLRSYIRGAKRRGYSFELSADEFRHVVTQPCRYCGSQQESLQKPLAKDSGDFLFTGIDRIDNDLGYTPSNSAPCCTTCNKMKLDMSEEAFYRHIKRICSHLNSKPLSANN